MTRYRMESRDGLLFVLEPYTVCGEAMMKRRYRTDPRFAGQRAVVVEADESEPVGVEQPVGEPLYY